MRCTPRTHQNKHHRQSPQTPDQRDQQEQPADQPPSQPICLHRTPRNHATTQPPTSHQRLHLAPIKLYATLTPSIASTPHLTSHRSRAYPKGARPPPLPSASPPVVLPSPLSGCGLTRPHSIALHVHITRCRKLLRHRPARRLACRSATLQAPRTCPSPCACLRLGRTGSRRA